MTSKFKHLWQLDPDIRSLNHGSYGACPTVVLDAQTALRADMEAEPVRFLSSERTQRLDDARTRLARFVGAPAEDMAFVPNATTGVNSVLRSLPLESGDEILVDDHAYNACRNAVDFVCERAGACVVVAEIPFPIESSQQVIDAVLGCVTNKTRLAMLDHITSPTALIFPIRRLVDDLQSRGIDVLVDGAHAPGMVPLELQRLGAAYYTGNCHKWLCSPKGAGFLYVRPDLQERVRPAVISHGANTRRPGRSRFQDEFDWTGTYDLTPYLAIPIAIDFLAGQFEGGWTELRQRNRDLTLAARDLLINALGIRAPAPDDMLGSMASVPLPVAATRAASVHDRLVDEFGIQVPVMPWPHPEGTYLRVSAQLYNDLDDFERLATALPSVIRGG
jgi:isopenicillin-N epimerase